MTIEYKLYPLKQLIITTAGNRLAEDELLDYIKELTSSEYVADYDHLVDLRAVKEIELSSIAIIKTYANIAASVDKVESESRLAIVATLNDLFGLSRVYEEYRKLELSSSKRVSVFKSMDSALWFLGRDTIGEDDKYW